MSIILGTKGFTKPHDDAKQGTHNILLNFVRVKFLLFFQWVSTHCLSVLVVDNGLKPIGLFV